MAKLRFNPDPVYNEYLSLVFYLDRELPSRSILEIPLAMAAFTANATDAPPLHVSIYQRDTVKPTKARVDLRACNVDELTESLPEDADTLTAGCDRKAKDAKAYVSIWNIDYYKSGRIQGTDNEPMDARLCMHLNCCLFTPTKDRFKRIGEFLTAESTVDARAGAILDRCLEIVSGLPSVYYGHVEIAYGGDIGCGLYYNSPDIAPGLTGPLPEHRMLNHAQWREAGAERRNFVRGVYWGNYLGPELAQRFDPSGDLVRRFMEFSVAPTREPPKPQWHRRFENGALFLALSESPLDQARFGERMFNLGDARCITAAWLHRRFAERGMVL